MSLAVLVPAQKKGGLSDHPICKAFDITSMIGLPLLSWGRTYAKFHALSSSTTMRQYPSLRSNFENRIDTPVSGTRAIAQMIWGMILPSSNIACCRANLLVLSFTDLRHSFNIIILQAKFRIILFLNFLVHYLLYCPTSLIDNTPPLLFVELLCGNIALPLDLEPILMVLWQWLF